MSAVVITKAPGYEHRRCPEQFNHGIVPKTYRSDWGVLINQSILLPSFAHARPPPVLEFQILEVLQTEVQTEVQARSNRQSLCNST